MIMNGQNLNLYSNIPQIMFESKVILWKYDNYRQRRILMQSANGPCPLLALVNCLSLRGGIILSHPGSYSSEELLSILKEYLIRFNPLKHESPDFADRSKNLSDAIGLLPSAFHGLDINIRFKSIDDFEYSNQMVLFDMCNVSLFHGWVISKDDPLFFYLKDQSYNSLLEKIAISQSENDKQYANPMQSLQNTSSLICTNPAIAQPEGKNPVSFIFGPPPKVSQLQNDTSFHIMQTTLPPPVIIPSVSTPSFSSESSTKTLQSNVEDFHQSASLSLQPQSPPIVPLPFSSTTSFSSPTFSGVSGDKQIQSSPIASSSISQQSGISESNQASNTFAVNYQSHLQQQLLPQLPQPLSVSGHFSSSSALQSPPSAELSPNTISSGDVTQSSKGSSSVTPSEKEVEVYKQFISSASSEMQLTYEGLFELNAKMREGSLAILFKANHFSVITKSFNQIHELVTTQGIASCPNVVWMRIDGINNETTICNADFWPLEPGSTPPDGYSSKLSEIPQSKIPIITNHLSQYGSPWYSGRTKPTAKEKQILSEKDKEDCAIL
ncbi:putative Protein FAM63A [Monocercomonoides exilis]|uniref:putative Protein FAM63A n=1 Tax=Monocercomonoides exilis TaxID=2049356 RepID=UPI003559C743|nr:putative Protein FAM63A [Monocercomonoides exilis]|eukprot:MONOS_13236.1-p1 / transcript=MONOS_13236.1 / gene=MONOS_13236 / organism=Monocercomonoides_exilis_PA203 / gene_product=hint module family protein / transcript_product=hint module family protein / location=Mono_scaffold00795:13249-15260(-) / protein_length=551 / sequence_SO=supercontig / SO=protein_coding / is_pseudo=false